MTPAPELELWQTEWCPASHRVRQRLTELGLSAVIHQVPVDGEQRTALLAATGHRSIPVLVAGDTIVADEAAILEYLADHHPEPAEAAQQRAKAAMAHRKQLERECPQLTAPTA